MILLNPWLLGGVHRITEKQPGLCSWLWILLEGSYIDKFPTVVREKYREKLPWIKSLIGQMRFEFYNGRRSSSGAFVVQKDAKHKIAESEIEGHDGFLSDGLNDGIQFHLGSHLVFFTVA